VVDEKPRTWKTEVGPVTGPEPRRNTATIRTVDVIRLIGCAAASIGLTSWLFFFALPLQGAIGFIVVAYLIFLVLFALLTAFDENGPTVRDRLIAVIVHSLAFLLLLALASVVIYTVGRGIEPLQNLNFFTQDMSRAGPLDPADRGRRHPRRRGHPDPDHDRARDQHSARAHDRDLPQRVPRRLRAVRAHRRRGDDSAAVDRRGSLHLCDGHRVPRLRKVGLRRVARHHGHDAADHHPVGGCRAASRARQPQGGGTRARASTWRTVWTVTLPTARSGLTTAIILGTARGIGETSPVLLTAGATTFLNLNPFSGPMTSLPLTTFTFVKSPEDTMIARGFGTAAVLMVLVLLLFALARAIGGRGPGQLTRRQQRARERQSRDDDYRARARALGLNPDARPARAKPAPRPPRKPVLPSLRKRPTLTVEAPAVDAPAIDTTPSEETS
jgi:phosphate transport system permease protein